MREIFKKILEKSIPFYKKGRKWDVEHIKWLFKIIPEFVDEREVDYDILIPLVVLHDVGYSKVPKNADPLKLDVRKLHSVEGEKIAEKILKEVNYPKEKIKEIKRLILKHDNWAFGDSFSNEPVLRIFNNFDFMWIVSKKGFIAYSKMVHGSPRKTIKVIEEAQRKNVSDGRKWYNENIGKYYLKLLEERKEAIK